MRRAFQSPYGGGGRFDNVTMLTVLFAPKFQSPYGGRGRSDRYS